MEFRKCKGMCSVFGPVFHIWALRQVAPRKFKVKENERFLYHLIELSKLIKVYKNTIC